MKEIKIEANSDICDYCKYYYISDKILQARMCCACSPTINFSGIECIKLTDEKEKNIHLKELIEQLNEYTTQELIGFIIDNITVDNEGYVTMRTVTNIKKGEE